MPDETHFNSASPTVKELWQKFERHEVRQWFPTVEGPKDFWAVCCRCMTALGYQSKGKRIRIQTDTLHPNGKDRHGNARYSQSQVIYFAAWLVMEEGGSELFRELFPVIVQAIEDRLERERVERQKWRDSAASRGSPAEWDEAA